MPVPSHAATAATATGNVVHMPPPARAPAHAGCPGKLCDRLTSQAPGRAVSRRCHKFDNGDEKHCQALCHDRANHPEILDQSTCGSQKLKRARARRLMMRTEAAAGHELFPGDFGGASHTGSSTDARKVEPCAATFAGDCSDSMPSCASAESPQFTLQQADEHGPSPDDDAAWKDEPCEATLQGILQTQCPAPSCPPSESPQSTTSASSSWTTTTASELARQEPKKKCWADMSDSD